MVAVKSAEAEVGPPVLRDKVQIFGMPLDVAAYELAVRKHQATARSRLVEHVLDQFGRKAATFEGRVDLRVEERPCLPVVVILDEPGKLIIDRNLDAALFYVVVNHRVRHHNPVVTVDEVRALAMTLPHTTEHLIHDRVKFRIGRIVYIAFSRDETLMGFAFPKEERAALVASEPDKFQMPGQSDLRYNWVIARLDALSEQEMRELVLEAWRMCVPKRVSREHLAET